jgi:hypothetical protein|tara:strand:- start:12865 stop:12999 length:135 start_codon:yes stop_codon:yes gene_type:complete
MLLILVTLISTLGSIIRLAFLKKIYLVDFSLHHSLLTVQYFPHE